MTLQIPIFMFFLGVGLLSTNAGSFDQGSKQQPEPKFADLEPTDIASLEKQRALVASAAKERYGTAALTKTKQDLLILQRLIDDKVFSKTQTYELQSLGVAFGDVLASELPLHWVMVTDEFGTDPTLRFKETTLNVNALTMISKRVEKGERPNLSELLRFTKEQLDSWGQQSPK